MAKPAFIYAFDNLGSERFAEFCGALLATRYKGFLLGGVGADGGVDGEIDPTLSWGEWYPETGSLLLDEIIDSGQTVIFQFKHKVVARVGQANSRTALLDMYKCRSNKKCELHSSLIEKKHPTVYVLVTNVEINAPFRTKFIEQCRAENPAIQCFQVIGLDEIEMWLNSQSHLGHLYFPTIFGIPRFDLRINILNGFVHIGGLSLELFQVKISNIGQSISYVSYSSIQFRALVDGKSQWFIIVEDIYDVVLRGVNPSGVVKLPPGRSVIYNFKLSKLREIRDTTPDSNTVPVEVAVIDDIGNFYSAIIPDNIRENLMSGEDDSDN